VAAMEAPLERAGGVGTFNSDFFPHFFRVFSNFFHFFPHFFAVFPIFSPFLPFFLSFSPSFFPVHIQENLEDALVQEALQTGVDLRQYSRQVELELQEVERASIQDCILKNCPQKCIKIT
uniref:Uncharacterized protein n=1 Tax=Cyanistes caeruleus TaxID=156563 RepID=A0A8C0UCA7_CYACU